ncbi:hypothetical protein [Streptomyces sp. NBC_01176]|uniref:hypothetical protein n=1 Tax=Streptomyces sp. NBC_01176 TaxID=2903760 RepID=UPI003869215B|nr:hypothetical protein OG199_20165 [Streptomyces sp. NBC_01176]
MDPLQRTGAVALIEDGFDSVEAVEGPDGMEADLLDRIVVVYPGGAFLQVFVIAPALELPRRLCGLSWVNCSHDPSC